MSSVPQLVPQFKSPASRRSKVERIDDENRRARERALERGLEETFPASDPVAIIQPSAVTGPGDAFEATRHRCAPSPPRYA